MPKADRNGGTAVGQHFQQESGALTEHVLTSESVTAAGEKAVLRLSKTELGERPRVPEWAPFHVQHRRWKDWTLVEQIMGADGRKPQMSTASAV